MTNIGKLKDGTKITSLIPYAIVFSDRTFIPACPKDLADLFTPIKLEEDVVLPSGVKTLRITWHLTEKQKQQLDLFQKNGRLVIVSRTVLDALNRNPEERLTRFAYCVGQKATEATVNAKPNERVVDVTCWMY